MKAGKRVSKQKKTVGQAAASSGHLFDRVADQMEAKAASEAYKPGDRLPSERTLALGFQVSRAVIREAIRILCERGLLEARPKSGVYVKGHARTPLRGEKHSGAHRLVLLDLLRQ